MKTGRSLTFSRTAVIALVSVAMICFVAFRPDPDTDHPSGSIFNSNKSGSTVFYELIQRLGFKTAVNRLDFEAFAKTRKPEMSALIIIAPTNDLLVPGLSDIREWVRSGGFALIASDDPEVLNSIRVNMGLSYKNEIKIKPRLQKVTTTFIQGREDYEIPIKSNLRISSRLDNADVLLYDDDGKAVAARLKHGKGCFFVFSDYAIFQNINSKKGDSAYLAVSALSLLVLGMPKGAQIYYDEYTHGFAAPGANRLGRLESVQEVVFIQLIIAGLFLVLYKGRRFGRPISAHASDDEDATLYYSDYVKGLGNLLHKAGAGRTAVSALSRRLKMMREKVLLKPEDEAFISRALSEAETYIASQSQENQGFVDIMAELAEAERRIKKK